MFVRVDSVISEVDKLNKRGSIFEPCGTPAKKGLKFDITITANNLFVIKDII